MISKKFLITIVGIIFFSFLVASSLHRKNITNKELAVEQVREKHDSVEEVIPLDEYGINYMDYEIKEGKVNRRQTLAGILTDFDVNHTTIHDISVEMQDVFEPRLIRAGHNYYGYFTSDSLAQLKYFIYEPSPMNFLKIDLTTDSIKVSKQEREINIVSKEASGIIQASLWQTMEDNDLTFELAISLSEILAWEVDFYRLYPGDRFKVFYDESYVEDNSIGIDNIHGVYFFHRGREIYGFNFQNDTIDGYYDKEGENLRKVFLKAPLKFYRISSGFSHSRLHPIHGDRRPHLGTDYAASAGTPILAVGDGVVTERSYTRGNGNYIRIRHNSVYETQYLHMSRFAEGVRPGTYVEQGDVIGYVGSTGMATGPHVCFRFWKNGQQVNHRRLEFPSADPLPEDYFEEFNMVRDSIMEILNNIPFKQDEEAPV